MTPEMKAKWVEALRSGEYKQRAGYLCRDNRYCCLGVLAHINGDLVLSEDMQFPPNTMVLKENTDSCAVLPLTYNKKYGIPEQHTKALMLMNDATRKSFSGIADWIDENI